MFVRFKVFRDPAIKKAKASVAKKGGFRKRKPKWVRKDALRAMLPLLKETRPGVGDLNVFAMLFIFSYAFLLRVPSEALPVKHARGGDCVVSVENRKVVLTLAHRFGALVVYMNRATCALSVIVCLGRISQREADWCAGAGAMMRRICVRCTYWALSSSVGRQGNLCFRVSLQRRPRASCGFVCMVWACRDTRSTVCTIFGEGMPWIWLRLAHRCGRSWALGSGDRRLSCNI